MKQKRRKKNAGLTAKELKRWYERINEIVDRRGKHYRELVYRQPTVKNAVEKELVTRHESVRSASSAHCFLNLPEVL